MDAVHERVEKRKRSVWKPATIILLLLALFAAFATYEALQPQYSFLRGLEPVLRADPQELAASTGSAAAFPPMFLELYSVRGSYEDWQERVEPEMLQQGAVKQPSLEDQMRKDLKGHPQVVVEEALTSIKDFPRTDSWEFGEKTSMRYPNRGVQIIKDVKFAKGQAIVLYRTPPKAPGWVTIAVYEPQKPTFFSKIGDWVKSVFKRR